MSPTAFRLAAVASILLSAMAACIDLLFPSLLSPALAEAWQDEPIPPLFDSWWLLAPSIALAVLLVASAIGLFLFKPWGRAGCLLTTFMAIGTYPFSGSTVMSGSATLFYDSASLLWGAVLAIAYFSPLKERFNRPT